MKEGVSLMKIFQHANRIAIAVGLALMTVGASGPALASFVPNTVYTTADSGPGSLRDTIANVPPGGTVYLGLLPQNSVIALISGPLTIDKNLTLFSFATQNVAISGNDTSRVISITAPVSVTLHGLTITRGQIAGDCDATIGAGAGVYAVGGELTVINSVITGNNASCYTGIGTFGDGGIASEGAVIIRNSIIENNTGVSATSGAGGVAAKQRLVLVDSIVRGNSGYAGVRAAWDTRIERSRITANSELGVDALRGNVRVVISASAILSNTRDGIISAGLLTVTDSVFSGNGGLGIFNVGSAFISRSTISANAEGGLINNYRLTLVNSTISGNGGAPASTGAFFQDPDAFAETAFAFIASSTIVSNTASASNLPRSGLTIDGGSVEIQNSIVAGNGITNNFAIWSSARLTSLGYNLTNSTDVLTATGDLTGTLPLLGPLQNNGGQTPTHALLLGSPAIDAANPAGCVGGGGALLTSDQRGFPREADGNGDSLRRCDIGAYEVWNPTEIQYLPFLPN
jgi:hypothetical protein